VPAVRAGVDGLLHRAQQHRVDLLRVGPVLRGRGDGLVLTRLGIVADRQPEAQGLQVVLQQRLLLGRGAFVHAVQRRMLVRRDEIGRAHVGREHGLLDEAVRIGARARHDLLDAAVVVAHDLGLGGLEVHRTTPAALLEQRAVHVVQVQQVRHEVLAARGLGPAGVAEDGRHFGVGEARMRADHRREELVRVDRSLLRDQHVAHHREAVLVGVERTQAVRELLGQHRDHAAREVDRRGALVRVLVDGLARLHVVAHVGDGDHEAPAVERGLAAARLQRFAVHRVVEVARVLAVDGDERHVGEVDAVLAVDRADLVGQARGLSQRLG